MKIEDVMTEWEKDSTISGTDLAGSSIETPKLYTKYLRYWSASTLHLKKLKSDHDTLCREKKEYYSGHADRKTLEAKGLKQFQRVLLKDDLDNHIKTDSEVKNSALMIDYQENLVNVIDKILWQLANRRHEIRNAIDWMRFQSGDR